MCVVLYEKNGTHFALIPRDSMKCVLQTNINEWRSLSTISIHKYNGKIVDEFWAPILKSSLNISSQAMLVSLMNEWFA